MVFVLKNYHCTPRDVFPEVDYLAVLNVDNVAPLPRAQGGSPKSLGRLSEEWLRPESNGTCGSAITSNCASVTIRVIVDPLVVPSDCGLRQNRWMVVSLPRPAAGLAFITRSRDFSTWLNSRVKRHDSPLNSTRSRQARKPKLSSLISSPLPSGSFCFACLFLSALHRQAIHKSVNQIYTI